MKILSLKSQFAEKIRGHQEAVEKSFNPSQVEVLEKISEATAKALRSGGKILLCGNGGSAADCQHIAAEFVGRFKRERQSLPAIALTTDTSILTALGNDYGYEKVFARQVEGLGKKGDILFALSTSGQSKNVLEAVREAKGQGLVTVGWTGITGGALKSAADLCFQAQSSETPHIQEIHITALHALSEVVEDLVLSTP